MINIDSIPNKPGIYLFKKGSDILYVGKAKDLKKRVSSYFRNNHSDFKTSVLIKKANNIEWIITKNEVEALILENNYIKKYQPKFNIKLTDDKTYPYIKINLSQEYPFIQITRKKIDDNSMYFGPYTSALKLKQVINFINKNFKLKKCTDKKFKNRLRPCLYYQMNLCFAPCCRKVSKEEYLDNLKQVILFLKGENERLIKELKDKMLKFSNELKFEKAAFYRDLIANINAISQSQIMEENSFFNKDVFFYIKKERIYHITIIQLKNGKIINSKYLHLADKAILNNSIIEELIPKFYNSKALIPDKIIVHEEINFQLLKDFLKKEFAKSVDISLPDETSDNDLINFAKENLMEKIRLYELKKDKKIFLKQKLHLKNIPNRIDAFDISTFRGKSSVGTRVTFINEKPAKNFYRKYKIKTINENILNDFAMMYEVVLRSCREYIDKKEFPDLIIIDGGKGQLSSAIKALKMYNLQKKIDIIAIAKENNNYDKIYIANRKNSINLDKFPDIILFIMKIRDEVHRFSINYHKNREESKMLNSLLLEIEGIGAKRAQLLLQYYKSIDNIKKAPLQELERLPFLNKKVAQNLYNFFKLQ